MSFKNFEELKQLDSEIVKKEIIEAKKQLFELRLQKSTRQAFKSHSFKHLKRKIAQLLTIETSRRN
jgi:large subunit ribosomal protein L29